MLELQSLRGDWKMSDCTPLFFLRNCPNLTKKPQKNNSIGNWELLAVKVAFEEWRHWPEGAEQLFLVWTETQEFGITAKCLNSRQARRALFFNHFHFQLSYRPSSKNTMPDPLSRNHSPDLMTKYLEFILP